MYTEHKLALLVTGFKDVTVSNGELVIDGREHNYLDTKIAYMNVVKKFGITFTIGLNEVTITDKEGETDSSPIDNILQAESVMLGLVATYCWHHQMNNMDNIKNTWIIESGIMI